MRGIGRWRNDRPSTYPAMPTFVKGVYSCYWNPIELFILIPMFFLILTDAISHNKRTEEDCCDDVNHNITFRFSM